MRNRRIWVVSFVAVLLMASLAGCMAGGVTTPEREVTVDVDTALAAQAKLADLMMGEAQWSESEFSSLLSVLLQQNSGENSPVAGVNVWFEPNNMVVIRAKLKEGVLPPAFGDAITLAGTVGVQDNHVMVDIDAVGVGEMSATGPVVDMVSAQINSALADPSMGVAADVSTDTGMVTVGIGGM